MYSELISICAIAICANGIRGDLIMGVGQSLDTLLGASRVTNMKLENAATPLFEILI